MRAKLVVGSAVGFFIAACSTGGSSSSSGIEATSASYIAYEKDVVLVTNSGDCVRSSSWSEDDTIGACEGEEVAAAPAVSAPVAEPTPVAPPPPPPAAPAALAEEVSLVGRTMFQFDSDLLSTEGSNEMRQLAALLRSYEDVKQVEVVGHTDNKGPSEYNQALSERRAETVKEWFESVVPGFPVIATGAGESMPLASNDTSDGRRLNRRVEIKVEAVR